MFDDQALAILRDYSAGRRGTRATLEALDLHDYADLVIALAQNDLPFPPPSEAQQVVEDRKRAAALLRPLLSHAG